MKSVFITVMIVCMSLVGLSGCTTMNNPEMVGSIVNSLTPMVSNWIDEQVASNPDVTDVKKKDRQVLIATAARAGLGVFQKYNDSNKFAGLNSDQISKIVLTELESSRTWAIAEFGKDPLQLVLEKTNELKGVTLDPKYVEQAKTLIGLVLNFLKSNNINVDTNVDNILNQMLVIQTV